MLKKILTIKNLPTIVITPNPSLSVCDGSSATLTASGGASYLWSTGENTAQITVNSSGTYSVTGTGSNGCQNIASAAFTVNPLPTISISASSTSICAGDSVFIGGGYQFITGLYEDTLTAQGGCDSIIVTALNVNPITVYSDTMYMCSGDSVFVGGAFQYSTGLYSDTLISTAGCDSVLETYLQVDSILFSYDSIVLCSGDSALIGGTYQSTGGI